MRGFQKRTFVCCKFIFLKFIYSTFSSHSDNFV